MNISLHHVCDYSESSRKKGSGNSKWDVGVWSNFVNYEDTYIGSRRVGNCWGDDQIEIFRLDKKFNLIYSNSVTDGEDPRTFLYNGVPYCLTWYPRQSVFDYKVINLLTEEVHNLTIEGYPETKVNILGKNWIPFVKNKELYFITTIDPHLSIIKYDPTTNHCTWVTTDIHAQTISHSRGGTPLLFSSQHKCFYGLGHRTHSGDRHNPFLYTLSEDLTKVTIGDDILDSGGVFDPLSLYEENGKIYCCSGFSGKHLNDSTSAKSCLYEVVINEA